MYLPGSPPSLAAAAARIAVRATWLLATVALAISCDSSTGPVDDTFILQGEVVFRGSQSHNLLTRDEGIVRIEIVDLTPKLLDITAGRNLIIGFGIGRPGEQPCETTFRTTAREGSRFSFGLEKGTEYCLLLFDSGALPEDAVIEYTVAVQPD